MFPAHIYPLLHLDYMVIVEFEMIFQHLRPFILEVELWEN